MKRVRNGLLALALTGALQGCIAPVAVGVGSGALMAADRRTNGAYIEDEAIENKALNEIAHRYKDQVHVNVTSFNRRVLVSGEVPDAAIKAAVGKVVADTEAVAAVNNELVVSGLSGFAARSNDTLITSNVKTQFLASNKFKANHVKVVTENGTVFLLGLVCKPEADAATDIASSASGVERVVRLFEYIECPPPPPPPAKK